jgi:integrase
VRWRDSAGVQQSRQAPTKAAALELAREVEHARALGRDWAPAVRVEPPALIDVAERYLRAMAPSWSKRTLRVRTDQLQTWLRAAEALGASTAAHLSRPHLTDVYTWLTSGHGRHGRPRLPSTARRYVGTVELCWAWAADWSDEIPGWRGQIPAPRRITPNLRRPAAEYRPAATWSEMARAVAAAPDPLRGLLLVEGLTGLRVGQVLALRRSDLRVDFDGAAWLRVRPELGKSAAERSGREVPASGHLVAWAASLDAAEVWLVPFPRRESDDRDRRGAAAAWTAAGVRRDCWGRRPHHAFRAGWISSLLSSGAELPAVELLVGHAPVATATSYIDPRALPLRAAVELVPDLRTLGGW